MPEIRDIGVDVKPPKGEWDGNMFQQKKKKSLPK